MNTKQNSIADTINSNLNKNVRLASQIPINIIQANLDRSNKTQHEFMQYFISRQCDVALISEPYTGNTGVIKSTAGIITYQNLTRDRVKAAIVIRAGLGATIGVSEHSTSNLVIIQLITKNFKIYFISVYIEPKDDTDSTLNKLEHFVKTHPHARIIIGGDFNGWHQSWGSARVNKRGKDLMRFITANDLTIGNTGTVPTFETITHGTHRTSIIDISLFTDNIANCIMNWKVNLDICPTSQHNGIEYKIELNNRNKILSRKKQSTYKYNTKNADWNKFKLELNKKIIKQNLNATDIDKLDQSQIEDYITDITIAIQKTCNITLRPKINNYVTIPWWTSELEKLKLNMIKLHHRIHDLKKGKKQLDNILKEREEMRLKYIEAIKSESTKNFREFCSAQGKENVWSLTNRLLKNGPPPIPPISLRKPDGTHTVSSVDTASTLLNKFYPDDTEHNDSESQIQLRRHATIPPDTENDKLFTLNEIINNLKNMNANKAPGPDHLTADICLKFTLEFPNIILDVFNRCFTLGYFPEQWKVAKVVALPKSNKNNYIDISGYRPIGLINIFGKLLEKTIAQRLTHHIQINNFNNALQFGFKKQTSTIDALKTAITKIKNAKQNKEQVIAISLDIQAAFDNAWWPVLFKRLKTMRCPRNLYILIRSYMQQRKVYLDYADVTTSKEMTRGCIQGSVLGPLFWNIILDDLFDVPLPIGSHLQAFADDILLIVHDKNIYNLEITANNFLNKIVQWGEKVKLEFGPDKTHVIPFTNKAKNIKIRINYKTIEHTKQIKFLGIIIDQNLKFIHHTKYITQKAHAIYRSICRFVRPTWGLCSENIKIIYEHVIEPIVTYAAGVWGDATKYKTVCDILKSMQRMFAIRIIRGFRTVSASAAIALASLIPLHLKIQEVLKIDSVKYNLVYENLPQDIKLEKPIPISNLLHPADRISITIHKATTTIEINSLELHNYTRIFTDGSKLSDDRVGAAFVAYSPNGSHCIKKYHLHSSCSVFQAELYAINKAIEWAIKKHMNVISILTDSLSGLEAINDFENTNPQIASIHSKIHKLNIVGSITFVWVKSHVGIDGNEAADAAAKSAAASDSVYSYDYTNFPISYVKRDIKQNILTKANDEYVTAKTGQHTKTLLPSTESIQLLNSKIKMLPVTSLFHLTQYLTGHGFHLEYLNRFKIKNSNLCPCHNITSQTLQHLLQDCTRYEALRIKHKVLCNMSEIDTPFNITSLLNNDTCFKSFVQLISNIIQTLKEFNTTVS